MILYNPNKYSITVEPAFLCREAEWVCLCSERLGLCQNHCLTRPALVSFVVLVTAAAVEPSLGLPLITYITAVILSSGGSILVGEL
jgi:hypothetical protein